MSRVLAVRLDSAGDVLVCGPAVRALAATATSLDLLVSPRGRAAADLLPGVDRVLEWDAPWAGFSAPPVRESAVHALVATLRRRRYACAVVFTSAHQSPLPMALLARLAGIGFVAADSHDYPGSLLDLRHSRGGAGEQPEATDAHEVVAALSLACAAGGRLPPGDDGRMALRHPLPSVEHLVPRRPYVVLHPGADVPARAPTPAHAHAIAQALAAAGWSVLVTGGPGEAALARAVAGESATSVAGRTELAELAAVLAGAAALVVGNTGPAHLAAAVGTPVVSLFAPVVPATRWAPYGVPVVRLGDQLAPCRGTRARQCPVPGHPCLSGIDPREVVAAVEALTRTGAVVPT